MKNVLTKLAKSVLIPLGWTAAAPVTDAAIQKKIHGSETYGLGTTALIISNEEMEDIKRIVKSFEKSGLLLKVLVKQLKMKRKNNEVDFVYVIRYIRC